MRAKIRSAGNLSQNPQKANIDKYTVSQKKTRHSTHVDNFVKY